MSEMDLHRDIQDLSISEEEDIGPWRTQRQIESTVPDLFSPEPLDITRPRILRTFNPQDWMPYIEPVVVRAEATTGVQSQSQTDGASNAIRNDLRDLEEAQEELLDQIRTLEQAHAQLENARNELMQILLGLEDDMRSNTLENPTTTRMMTSSFAGQVGAQRSRGGREPRRDEESSDDEEDEEDMYDDVYDNPFRQRGHFGLGLLEAVSHRQQQVLSAFVDENGDPCSSFDECIRRTVEWAENEPYWSGLDPNGNPWDDPSHKQSILR
jgi:hypothetical protein